jgi:type IV pilus assembly protein PilW
MTKTSTFNSKRQVFSRSQSCQSFSVKGIKLTNGFTLVEIMVAMVIGLLGVLVIMQVFALFEGQKRATSGGADAQNNGVINLYGIERDIRQSGWNLTAPNFIGCNATLPNGYTIPLAPVTINPPDSLVYHGDTNTDTLLVVYGNSNGASEGDVIDAQLVTNQYAVATPTAFNTNDLVVAEPKTRPSPCNLIMETATVPLPKVNVYVTTGVTGMVTGNLYNLGPRPRILAYAIRNGTLTVCDYMASDCSNSALTSTGSVWVPIGDNIVSMRAQYGRDTNASMDGVVDTYDQATPTTNCGWLKTSAIQIVLVARSAQPEKPGIVATSDSAIDWSGQSDSASGITPSILSAPISLTATSVPTGYSWNNYRYKIFETIIPLRNIATVLALSKDAGC